MANWARGEPNALGETLLSGNQAVLGEVSSHHVPPHEFSRVSFGIPPGGPGPTFDVAAAAGSVAVRVDYIDLAGNMWASNLTLVPTSDLSGDWQVGDFNIKGLGEKSIGKNSAA